MGPRIKGGAELRRVAGQETRHPAPVTDPPPRVRIVTRVGQGRQDDIRLATPLRAFSTASLCCDAR